MHVISFDPHDCPTVRTGLRCLTCKWQSEEQDLGSSQLLCTCVLQRTPPPLLLSRPEEYLMRSSGIVKHWIRKSFRDNLYSSLIAFLRHLRPGRVCLGS